VQGSGTCIHCTASVEAGYLCYNCEYTIRQNVLHEHPLMACQGCNWGTGAQEQACGTLAGLVSPAACTTLMKVSSSGMPVSGPLSDTQPQITCSSKQADTSAGTVLCAQTKQLCEACCRRPGPSRKRSIKRHTEEARTDQAQGWLGEGQHRRLHSALAGTGARPSVWGSVTHGGAAKRGRAAATAKQ